jgi:hypothetical protein
VLDAKLANNFAARIPNWTMEEFVEPRRELAREDVEVLENADDARELGALRTILDLHGDSQSARGDGDGVHTLGADLGDDSAFGLLDENRIEAVRAADQEGARLHRVNDTASHLVILTGGAGEIRVRAGHALEREREDNGAATVDGASDR